MSWIEKLYRTYENNLVHIGDRNDAVPLLPICHTTQNAHVHVVLNESGNFLRASVVPKNEARTIIPATEESAGRTSGYVPHPLCDKLQYVAGDYSRYGGTKPSKFEEYCDNLESWRSSQYSHPKIRAVLFYVRKKRLIEDLIDAKILHLDDRRRLLEKWPGESKEAPEIFKVIQGGQGEAFVRFSVEVQGDPQSALWTDGKLWKCWEDYYAAKKSGKGLCYVTGEQILLADQHPSKLRNPGDKAKLISSNDKSGYTFRGRFTTADEACGVGFEVTQKAHNALRWLIVRQGWRDGEQAIVAWAVTGVDIPDPLADTASLLSKAHIEPVSTSTGDTAQDIGIRLSKLFAGYSMKLGPTDDVVVMGLDSATPGRMAISFYGELTGSEYLKNVKAWHEGCCWLQRFNKEKVFIGAPAPRDIAEAAYGKSLDGSKTLRKATVERLLPCIVHGEPIPHDLVESCVRWASNRHGFESWQWEKTLGVTCALYRYQHKERSYSMALERDRKSRDYLYGRLLALAEHLENRALYVAGEKRETNAGRLMQRFADRPYSTWRVIEISLSPYKTRLRARRPAFLHNVEKEIDEVASSFAAEDFLSDMRLDGEFLLGYHCQRASLRAKPASADDDTDGDAED